MNLFRRRFFINKHLCSTSQPQENIDISQSTGEVEPIIYNNHEIMKNVFYYLDLPTLKNARLVCKFWGKEALRNFNKLLILLQPDLIDERNLPTLSSVVSKCLVPHTLQLSLLTNSWFYRMFEDWDNIEENIQLFFDQRENSCYSSKMLEHLQFNGFQVKELRLEIILVNKNDANLFGNLLKQLPNLQKFSLNIAIFKNTAFLQIPLDCVSRAVKSLGLSVLENFGSFKSETSRLLSAQSANYIIRLFRNIEYLDLQNWSKTSARICPDEDLVSKTTLLFEAIRNCPNSLKNIKGIRLLLKDRVLFRQHQIKAFISLPLASLRYICIQSSQPESSGGDMEQLLLNNWETLEFFDLFWFTIPCFKPTLRHLVSLPYLPKLKTLQISTDHWLDRKGWKEFMMDVFGLRSLFLKNEIKDVLPLLQSLNVLLPWEEDNKIWSYIFPAEMLLQKQITRLILSLNAKCTSPKITRLYTIFPFLVTFRHTIRKKQELISCQHKISNGVCLLKSQIGTINSEIFDPNFISFGQEMHRIMAIHNPQFFV